MCLTAFFKLYKIILCIFLHRCNLKILVKNRFEKSAIFVKISKNLLNAAAGCTDRCARWRTLDEEPLRRNRGEHSVVAALALTSSLSVHGTERNDPRFRLKSKTLNLDESSFCDNEHVSIVRATCFNLEQHPNRTVAKKHSHNRTLHSC